MRLDGGKKKMLVLYKPIRFTRASDQGNKTRANRMYKWPLCSTKWASEQMIGSLIHCDSHESDSARRNHRTYICLLLRQTARLHQTHYPQLDPHTPTLYASACLIHRVKETTHITNQTHLHMHHYRVIREVCFKHCNPSSKHCLFFRLAFTEAPDTQTECQEVYAQTKVSWPTFPVLHCIHLLLLCPNP